MGDLKARFKPLFRRTSTLNSSKSSASSVSSPVGDRSIQSKTSLLLSKNRKPSASEPVLEDQEDSTVELSANSPTAETQAVRGRSQQTPDTSLETSRSPLLEKDNPLLQVQEPTPQPLESSTKVVEEASEPKGGLEPFTDTGVQTELATSRPAGVPRTQSLAHSSQNRFLKTLLESEKPRPRSSNSDYFGGPPTISANMLHRKIWVKRPGASATLVTINEEDLVDDVRDMILRKYANSLGRTFDAPDVTLRIIPRDQANRNAYGERTLGPEEPISRTLDAYFPGGQSVGEALLIDVPQRRTPRHSPRVALPYYLADDLRPGESGTEYFPPMPVAGQHSPHLPSTLSGNHNGPAGAHNQPVHSIAILNPGQPPSLPSPGGRGTRHVLHTAHLAHGALRPKHVRSHTSTPPILTENLKTHANGIPVAPPLPNPPVPTDAPPHHVTTPSPRSSSPRPKLAHKRPKKQPEHPKLPAGLLDGAVPPINVLIVEDNIINLKLLEAFLKRLKVRWKTAMNGREAVTKWRAGGFHLVLMDIQLPVMNGLDATKEIRRLERLNNIGVFSGSASNTPALSSDHETTETFKKPEGEDCLMNTSLFKSPVIIVALTASSLQSDRHEALAAGCNDFLTKPVNFVWLERKVMEWGCMQALIDFDGWRKWKDFSQTQPTAAVGTSAPAAGNKASGHFKKSIMAAASKGSNNAGSNAGGSGGTGVKSPITAGRRDNRLSSSTVGTSTGTGSGTGSDLLDGEREPRGVGSAIVAGA